MNKLNRPVIADNLTQLIGNTPMLKLQGFAKYHSIKCNLIAKLEYFNPLGSSKDRVAAELVDNAFENKLIDSNTVIIEPTSGNTGIGLAFVGAVRGLKVILTLPENMSKERIMLLKALGAEVVLTPASEGMNGAINKANELKNLIGNAYIPDQFNNQSNVFAHKKSTAQEILRDTNGKVDYFIAGVGTGGTITGVAEVLKKHNKDVKIVAVEPESSAVLSGEEKGSHGLMGIGAGFVPGILNTELIDKIVKVNEAQAYETARSVAKTDGLLIGISSGAALYAASKIASEIADINTDIVVLLPDSGERYLSTPLFDDSVINK